MKKYLLLLLVALITLDVDAQLLLSDETTSATRTGFTASDEFSSMMVKKRKKRKSSRRKSTSKRKGSSSSSGLNVGGGLALGLPMGDFADGLKAGFGLNIDGDYFVTPEISAGVSTGFLKFGYKSDSMGGSGNFNILPFMVRGNYYFLEDAVRPYVGLGLGLFFSNSSYEFSWPSYFINPVTSDLDTVMFTTETSYHSTNLAIAPSAGVLINMADNLSLNMNLRYNIFSVKDASDKKLNYSFLGFNVGIIYSLAF